MPIVWVCVCVCVDIYLLRVCCKIYVLLLRIRHADKCSQNERSSHAPWHLLPLPPPLFSLPLPASCKWQTSAGHKRQTNWNGKWEAVCSCNCSWSCRTCAYVCACTEICHLPSPVVSSAATFSGNHRFALIRNFICSTYPCPPPHLPHSGKPISLRLRAINELRECLARVLPNCLRRGQVNCLWKNSQQFSARKIDQNDFLFFLVAFSGQLENAIWGPATCCMHIQLCHARCHVNFIYHDHSRAK